MAEAGMGRSSEMSWRMFTMPLSPSDAYALTGGEAEAMEREGEDAVAS